MNKRAIPQVDLTTVEGQRTYQRTVLLLLGVAVKRILPESTLSVEHSLSNGVYCEVHGPSPITPRDIAFLEQTMRELVATNMPIKVEDLPKKQAMELVAANGAPSAAKLIEHLPTPGVPMVSCADSYEFYIGPVLSQAGSVPHFSLHFYLPGLVLQIPEDNSGSIPPYREQPKLFGIYREAERWARILGVSDASSLNDAIRAGEGPDIVRVSEALHEKKIAEIADLIAENPDLRLITIAGPSSSGKTTFAQRLQIQLRVNGLHPVAISLDDYFLGRAETPLGEDGKPDFESINALDLPLLGEHLTQLIQGEAVDVPQFNFHTGKRTNTRRRLQINSDQPLIIEGIHGLNDLLTAAIPKGNKFKIYVSALTQVNVHEHVRIHTTDARLIRRIVRDAQFRSHPADGTIGMWPMVRRGERRNIFPFQEEADVMFNSALVYELPVLKAKAEPLLQAIPLDSPMRLVAESLIRLLSQFAPMADTEIPPNSILREFVGGSCFI